MAVCTIKADSRFAFFKEEFMKKTVFIVFRIAVTLISLVLLGFFAFPMLGGILNIGNLSGAAVCVWLVFVFGFRSLYLKFKAFMKKRRVTKFIINLANFCVVTFLVYGAVVSGAMLVCASKAPTDNATAVVLGAQVKSYGPSVMLRARIDAAYDYLEENPDTAAVVTGGQGSDEPMSEGKCMYDELTAYGILPDRVYVEDRAEDTTQNLKYSMQIISEENLNGDIAIVTDGFHQLRARLIAFQLGIEGDIGAVNADTSPLYFPTFTVREWFALPYQLLFP